MTIDFLTSYLGVSFLFCTDMRPCRQQEPWTHENSSHYDRVGKVRWGFVVNFFVYKEVKSGTGQQTAVGVQILCGNDGQHEDALGGGLN